MNQCPHRWHYGSMKGITLRICEYCGREEACFTDQAWYVWGDNDTTPTEPDDCEPYDECDLKIEPDEIDERRRKNRKLSQDPT